MEIKSFKLDRGSVYADIDLTKEDILAAHSVQGAVSAAIGSLCDAKGCEKLIYPRVTALDEHEDGSVGFSVEGAVPPEVILGPYLGVEVDMGHCESFEEAALLAAAKNLRVVIPEILIQRKIDGALLEKQQELLESLSLNTLADIRAIIKELNAQHTLCLDEEAVWSKAMQAAENYISMGMQDIGAFAHAFEGVLPVDSESIVRAAERRAHARGELAAEQIAEEVLDAWLHTENITREQWREAQRDGAETVCRIDFLLAAVADEEQITADADEIEQFTNAVAAQYMMSPDEVLATIGGVEAIKHNIRIAKANQIIVENAKNK